MTELYRPAAVRAHQAAPRGGEPEDPKARPIRPRWWPAVAAISMLAAAVATCLLVRVPVTARATPTGVDGETVTAVVVNGKQPGLGALAQVTTGGGTLSGEVVAGAPELRIRVPGLAADRVTAIAINLGSRPLLLDLLD
ncbi:hypothetical protein [Crossiella cryophila]|uniref:Uncharacterized protein n=1 Tax=Crossiella cryophila TaxID=43355 RepID=A0A7W7CD46_9PSEU|nr:hypothetical protein [Crossiella cryophila]MBB4678842.1 hypothetical protein [Crossiella cryophila]